MARGAGSAALSGTWILYRYLTVSKQFLSHLQPSIVSLRFRATVMDDHGAASAKADLVASDLSDRAVGTVLDLLVGIS